MSTSTKTEAKAATIFKCEPCKYESELKANYTRHCCSNAHLKACNMPLPPKKPTKKERDAAAEIEATRLREEAAAVLHLAELAKHAEELRLRDAELAVAMELAKPKAQVRKEMWALQAAAKLNAKELERADRLAFREKREANRAVQRLQQKDEKKLEYFEKCKVQLSEYVLTVCAEEVRDINKLVNAPNTINDYVSSVQRLGHYLSPYYGYTPESHLNMMRKASASALERILDEAKGDASCSAAIIEFDSERGKKHLTRLTDFHSTFKPRPWLPEKQNLKYTMFDFEGARYSAFYNEDTMRVYDYDVTVEIGRYDDRQNITFAAGMPTPEVLDN